ncbi:MAG: ornithine carbamoyltransferase [Bdellovibrionaceae bacterium]|nr:ornithine carbamoyltransferase [Pseudobdellovibrionaceae bacterium]
MFKIKSLHFLTGEELTHPELVDLLQVAEELRKSRGTKKLNTLQNQTMALIFEKPSLRTRLSFSVGVQELGGQVVELTSSQKKHEDPEDAIRVMQGIVHGVMLRTFAHENLERMAAKATIPIINGLSDLHHPCQALADLQTLLHAFGKLKGLKLAYVGDGNNVLHSLLLLLPMAGVDVHYCCPKGFEPDPFILERAHLRAAQAGSKIRSFKTPKSAVKGVNAIYTDVWTSMGAEDQADGRLQAFTGFQVNAELYSHAAANALIMHCLPMNKGQEISAEMIDHPCSALFQQAENRLHAQKALMLGIWNNLRKRSPEKVGDRSARTQVSWQPWTPSTLEID